MKPVITLTNLKVAEFASTDSTCFEATVYVDGKRFCVASDDGNGGGTDFHPMVTGASTHVNLVDHINKVGRRINPNAVDNYGDAGKVECDGDFDEWKDAHLVHIMQGDPSAYEVFDYFVSEALTKALITRDVKKAMRTKILFKKDDGCIYEISKRGRPVADLVVYINKKYPGSPILNTMPIDDAARMYKEAA